MTTTTTTTPTPRTPSMHTHQLRQLRQRAVVTVTSIAESTGTASSSSSSQKTPIPIGPIVGGIVAGVAAVLIVGGIWFWCHRKSEREKEEARERALARANRKAAGGARPTLIKNKSTTSDHSTKSSSAMHYAEKDQAGHASLPPPVPAIPTHYLASKNGGGGGYQGPTSAAAYGQERAYDQPQYVDQKTERPDHYAHDPSRSPISPTGSTGSSIPSPKSSTSGSSSSSSNDRRSRAQQRIDAANAAKEREAALAAANPSGRYQPARPSPLRAQEKKEEDDQSVPKWGSKPFRSANPSEQSQQQQQHPDPQPPAPVSLAPPVDTTRDKAVSGEWGVAYSDVDDGAGAFEHDDYDTRSDGRKSMGAADAGLMTSGGRQATGYAYDPSPRNRTVSGGPAPMPDRRSQQYQPQPQQQQYYGGGAPAYDPYAQP